MAKTRWLFGLGQSASILAGLSEMNNPNKGLGRNIAVINTEILEQFPYFVKHSGHIINDLSKARLREFNVITIIKLLSAIRYCDMTFSELHRSSNICMKRSYLNYLDMCKHFGLIEKRNGAYHCTDKGKVLLELFRI